MARRRRIPVEVPSRIQSRIDRAVESGQDRDASGVVLDAVRLWATHHRPRDEMDRLIEQGIRDAERGARRGEAAGP